MTSFLKTFWLLLRKESLLSLRAKESSISVVFFTFLVVLLFHFGFSGVEPQNIIPYLAAFLWLSTLFGGMLRLNQTFEPENEGKVMDGMRLVPGIAVPFFLSKFVSNLLFLFFLTLFTFLLLVFLFNIQNPLAYLAVAWCPLSLGIFGLASIGTLFSNMVISHHRRTLVLPIICYPILIPLIIGVLNAFVYSASGNLLGLEGSWIKILIVFDMIFFVMSLMLFELVMNT